MPYTLAPYVAFPGIMTAQPAFWNNPPPEGNRVVTAEIDWGTYGAGIISVQFNLAGNNVINFSQICALYVDNSRNGSDVDFYFPATGFVLTVPAYTQGLYPVITIGLDFYATSSGGVTGDVTILQVLNSLPPPVALQSTQEQSSDGSANILLDADATTQIVPTGINGTVKFINIVAALNNTSVPIAIAQLTLIDGASNTIWEAGVSAYENTANNVSFSIGPIVRRFVNGLSFMISFTTFTGGFCSVNVYYGVP